MRAAEAASPLTDADFAALLAPLAAFPRVLVALSGGPDSTALLWGAARWAASAPQAPVLVAATVDHALRPDSAREAQEAGRICTGLGVPHHVLTWCGPKPSTGIQDAARIARYGLLTACAAECGAGAVVLAHTLDDQAETVLFRLARGSGLSGLGGMRAMSRREGTVLARPLLSVPKSRLVATLRAAAIPFVEDPSNADARFARARLRALAPALAAEGLDAGRLATLARRMARADAALEHEVDVAAERLAPGPWIGELAVSLPREGFAALPQEVALRLLGRAIELFGHEGEAELGKLETLAKTLFEALAQPQVRVRRTLAGAMVTLDRRRVTVSRAPERRAGQGIAINSDESPSAILGKAETDT